MRSKKFSNKSYTCFMIKSVSSCSFFRYNYTTHNFALKLDDVRIKKRCFSFWTRCSSYYARYPTHTIKIFCQKENRFFVVAFTACDVFRILEITFTPGNFLIFFQFRHLLSILPYCSYGVNSILKRFIDQCWAIKNLLKKKV